MNPSADPVIAVEDIAHVRCQAPDLDRMEAFLTDFGLTRAQRSDSALYMRSRGGIGAHAHITQRGDTAATLGFGLQAQSAADLQRLAAHLGTYVAPNDEPGGGQRVRFIDPAGLQIDVLHGQQQPAPLPVTASRQANTIDRQHRLGQPLRQQPGPSNVMRLGHVVLLVPDFQAAFDFYTRVLGLRVSDTYHGPDPDAPVFAFLHCGLGERWTDHHTIALGTPPGGMAQGRFDHIAFEVLDLDDLMAGHAHLRDRGWRHSWGVGRHVQGSQIFDYWRDPWGLKVEHWTDGDRVNHSHSASTGPLTPQGLAQWAPPFNPEFFE